jgi:hypothetical protein
LYPKLDFAGFKAEQTKVLRDPEAVCLAKTSYTRKMNDLAKSSIRTIPIKFLP